MLTFLPLSVSVSLLSLLHSAQQSSKQSNKQSSAASQVSQVRYRGGSELLHARTHALQNKRPRVPSLTQWAAGHIGGNRAIGTATLYASWFLYVINLYTAHSIYILLYILHTLLPLLHAFFTFHVDFGGPFDCLFQLDGDTFIIMLGVCAKQIDVFKFYLPFITMFKPLLCHQGAPMHFIPNP